jgi:hypothetical protein
MASTRSTTSQRRAQRAAPSDTPRAALTELALRSARIQIAACAAVRGTADRFAQTVGDELLRRLDGGTESPELTTLPRGAADHFDARLGRAQTNHRRTR